MKFVTSRLICESLSFADYLIFETGAAPAWFTEQNPYQHLIVGPSPLQHRIPRVKQDPTFAELGLILATRMDTGEIIGSAGFHDFPDPNGMIEIGFGIVDEMQNQGFGKELLHGMWHEICKDPSVRILRYTVSPENLKSLHIIQSIGFDLVGEQMDEEDGLELIFEKSVADYLAL